MVKAIKINNGCVLYEGLTFAMKQHDGLTCHICLDTIDDNGTTRWSLTTAHECDIQKRYHTVDLSHLDNFMDNVCNNRTAMFIADEVADKWRIDKEDPSGIANGIAAKWSNK